MAHVWHIARQWERKKRVDDVDLMMLNNQLACSMVNPYGLSDFTMNARLTLL
ncbi:hypothetical protein SAMN05216299_10373 [Nitrosospira sp. Nsp14]|nr:hypothetical protein SAMN05216299_10373 [Nitrosospira sp. Nsp14]